MARKITLISSAVALCIGLMACADSYQSVPGYEDLQIQAPNMTAVHRRQPSLRGHWGDEPKMLGVTYYTNNATTLKFVVHRTHRNNVFDRWNEPMNDALSPQSKGLLLDTGTRTTHTYTFKHQFTKNSIKQSVFHFSVDHEIGNERFACNGSADKAHYEKGLAMCQSLRLEQ